MELGLQERTPNDYDLSVNTGRFCWDPIWLFSDDEHNGLVLSVLLENRGLVTRWVTSQFVDAQMTKMQSSLIIYDIAHAYSVASIEGQHAYYEKVAALPSSAFLVGLGEAQDIPRQFQDLRSRTTTFLAKPFDVNEAIRVCRLVRFNANSIPV